VVSTAIALAVVAGYAGYVLRFATNGIYWDEWNWVELLSKTNAGSLNFGDLWHQHNENRILFPNLIALGASGATGFNDLAFVYLGAIFLIAAVLLLVFALREELLEHPFAYLPVIFVLFSLAQYENALWGFQFNWFMVEACIAGTLALLSGTRLSWWRFLPAVALGVIASFSLLQGLTIWAAGLLPLLRPGTAGKWRISWYGAGVVSVGLYVNGLDFNAISGPPLKEFPSRLPTAIEGFFVAIGSVVPDLTQLGQSASGLLVTTVAGVIIALAGAAVVALWFLSGRSDRVLTVAAALVAVAVLFDLMLMPGRLSAGVVNGTVSRYTTFNLLLLAGVYIGAVRMLMIAREGRVPQRVAPSGVFAGLMFTLVCIQLPTSFHSGLIDGSTTRAYHLEAANLTANYQVAPPSMVAIFVYPPSYDYFQTQARFLESHGLNVFGDGESSTYQRTGVVDGGVVTSPLPVPAEFGPIKTDPGEWRAWLALSSVYEQRPDLQAAFPGSSLQTSRQMVAWALRSGLDPADPVDSAVLLPYATQYRVWLAEETAPL